jgi:hypothetical protein
MTDRDQDSIADSGRYREGRKELAKKRWENLTLLSINRHKTEMMLGRGGEDEEESCRQILQLSLWTSLWP